MLALSFTTLGAMAGLYVMLAVASLTVKLRASPGGQLRKQVNSWWYLFPVVSVSLLFSQNGPFLLTLVIFILAARELSLHCTGTRWHFVAPCAALMLWQTMTALLGIPSSNALLPAIMAVLILFWLYKRQVNTLLLFVFVAVVYSLGVIPRFLKTPMPQAVQISWLFFLFALTAINDIAQFISGTCLGKSKICAAISPNKTWAGLAGGVLVSLLVSVVLGRYMDLASAGPLMALALVLSVGGFFGDVLFSKVKRHLQIKDFSNLIPGHGGILDRVDSLVLTAPLLYFGLAFMLGRGLI